MKIEIDTKHDSHEEIKKVISMLSHLVGESIVTNKPVNIFEDPNSFGQGSSESSETPSSGEGMFSMFGAPATETSTEETTEAVEEKKDTVPEIIPY